MGERGSERTGPLGRLDSLAERHTRSSFPELRARILRGDPHAWRQFVERYSRTVYAFSLRLARGNRDREEIVQEAYLAVFENLLRNDFGVLRSFRGDAKFETYLFSAVRNEIGRLRRRAAAEDRRRRSDDERAPSDGPSQLERLAGDAGFAEAIGLEADRVAEIVRDQLERLDARERTILRVRFIDGLSYRELAERFDWKDTNAAAYEVCKALRKLGLLARCRETMRWGEPEREVLLECLRRWLGADRAGREG